MKKIVSFLAAVSVVVLMPATVSAQSESFRIGKSLDVQYAILRELKSSFVDTVQTDKLMKTGIDAMLGSLDPYTIYIPEDQDDDLELMTSGTYGGIGALITKKGLDSSVVITQPYEGSPAAKNGLLPGDRIIEIDGRSVMGENSQQSSDRMKGVPGTDVHFKIIRIRGGDTVNVTIRRERIHISSIDYYGIIRDSIGYVALSGFTENMSQEFRSDFLKLKGKGMKRLVIDLRGNGGGLMDEAIDLVSLFVPKNTLVVSSKGRLEDMNKDYYTKTQPLDTLIPILVMVNSGTASSSEITAGSLQDLDRGTIAGTRTFGKGLVQSIVPLPYNGKLKLTTAKYYTPSGRCVQAIDYSHRNEDGSVGQIPDSLTHEFHTRKGRIVRDGGGITPDIVEPSRVYSRPAVSLILSGVAEDYAMKYFAGHDSIVPAADFHMTDADYDDFVGFAGKRKFDARSSAEVELDALEKAAKKDAIYKPFKAQFDGLAKKLKIGKEEMLRLKRDEIQGILEAEIVAKYYFSSAGKIIDLRDDDQLYDSMDIWTGKKKMNAPTPETADDGVSE
ncbi:MAG: S41 family peptidase [Bacteroidales bacterium]|jgi:carboxyl-terminal processing protease|nr:S41 family peptidase [Bacteroidales bacterium]MCI2146327.1 S41 family peptidase [Bacteroidales bacterium]